MLEIDLTDLIPEYLENQEGDLAMIIEQAHATVVIKTEFSEFFESHEKYKTSSKEEDNHLTMSGNRLNDAGVLTKPLQSENLEEYSMQPKEVIIVKPVSNTYTSEKVTVVKKEVLPVSVKQNNPPEDPIVSANVKKRSTTKLFECDKCHKKYASKETLKQHYKLHTRGVSALTCDKCYKRFKSNSNLKQHYKVHTEGESVPTCDKCYKQFKNNDNLKQHYFLHNIHAISFALHNDFD